MLLSNYLIDNSQPNFRPKLKIGRGRGREKTPAPGIHGAGNPGRLLHRNTQISRFNADR